MLGATGMLAGVARHLAQTAQTLTIVARTPEDVELDAQAAVTRLAIDRDDTAELDRALATEGPFDLAVVWAQDEREPARVVAGHMTGRFVHVLSSAARDPSVDGTALELPGRDRPGLRYQVVVTGWVREEDGTRWHTPEEMSAELVDVLKRTDDPEVLIGHVRPWDEQPG